MLELCGVTKKEVMASFRFGVEIEYSNGFRNWELGNFSECCDIAKKASENGTFSDFDAMTTYHQTESMKTISEFWFEKKMTQEDRCITMNELFKKYGKEN